LGVPKRKRLTAVQKIRQALSNVGETLLKKDMVEYVLGTISARCPTIYGPVNFDFYLTKPRDRHYINMKPEDWVEVDINGNPLEPLKSPPSLNWLVHKACYEADPAIGAIVHAHIRSIVAFSSQENDNFESWFSEEKSMPKFMPMISEEACWALNPTNGYMGLRIVEDFSPDSLARAAKIWIPHFNAFAIRRHGIMTVGRNLEEALGIALVLKKEAEIIMDIYNSGGKPLFRNSAEIAESMKNMPPIFNWRNFNT
jgi:ribulose-5-phosphate 4-epimerase/fuculose-1-phosphate aldolase